MSDMCNLLSNVLLTSCLLFSLPALAEHTVIFKFDSVYHITGKSHCNRLRVIDMRENKTELGYYKTGVLNRDAKIVTEYPFDKMLTEYFDAMIKSSNIDNKELLAVLYDFRIEDRPNGDEVGIFHFDADFYMGNNNRYVFIGKADSIYEVSSNYDITRELKKFTPLKVGEILGDFAKRPFRDNSTFYTETNLLRKRYDDNQLFPIYSTSSFKKGIYYTVEDFMNHQPVDTPFVVSEQFNDDGVAVKRFVRFINEKGRKGALLKPETFYAVYDGKKWFISERNYLAAMSFKDGEFNAVRAFRGIRSNKETVAVMGAMFGLVGALASSGFKSRVETTGYYDAKFDPFCKCFRPYSRVR